MVDGLIEVWSSSLKATTSIAGRPLEIPLKALWVRTRRPNDLPRRNHPSSASQVQGEPSTEEGHC